MSDFNTLLLRETGIARLADGSEAVNVGPIVAALGFLTEGRGEDRGTDEHGEPLPDLLSLAFDVVKSIILGGRQAEYFRQVKLDVDAHAEAEGQTSLALAKQASAVRRSSASLPSAGVPSVALVKAGTELRARLQKLEEAAAQVLLELDALDDENPRKTRPRRKTKTKTKTKPKTKTKTKTKTNTRKKAAKRR